MAIHPTEVRHVLLGVCLPTAWLAALFIPLVYVSLGTCPSILGKCTTLEAFVRSHIESTLPDALLSPSSPASAFYTRCFLLAACAACLLVHAVCIDRLTRVSRPPPFVCRLSGTSEAETAETDAPYDKSPVTFVAGMTFFGGMLLEAGAGAMGVQWVPLCGSLHVVVGLTAGVAMWGFGLFRREDEGERGEVFVVEDEVWGEKRALLGAVEEA